MGTKYRRDLTAEDFRIVKRFKHHMHRLSINESIKLSEWTAPIAYEQNWYLAGIGWRDNGNKERKDVACYFLTMRDFRAVVRGVSTDIDTVTEGLVIETLKRFSLMLFTKDKKWKWTTEDGTPVIVLERQRLSPKGTIKKRNPETAKAKWEECAGKIIEIEKNLGMSYNEALKLNLTEGITRELIKDLYDRAEEAKTQKAEMRREIDERIVQRTGRLKN